MHLHYTNVRLWMLYFGNPYDKASRWTFAQTFAQSFAQEIGCANTDSRATPTIETTPNVCLTMQSFNAMYLYVLVRLILFCFVFLPVKFSCLFVWNVHLEIKSFSYPSFQRLPFLSKWVTFHKFSEYVHNRLFSAQVWLSLFSSCVSVYINVRSGVNVTFHLSASLPT